MALNICLNIDGHVACAAGISWAYAEVLLELTAEMRGVVIAYTAGSTSLILVIPICGGYIRGIVQIVYSILGLKSAHEISGFKATLAVLLPIFICCGSIGLAMRNRPALNRRTDFRWQSIRQRKVIEFVYSSTKRHKNRTPAQWPR